MAIHIDYETWSEADLGSVGAYRYAEDPTARILMFAVARDGDEPLVWDFMDQNSKESRQAVSMLREAIQTKELIYAHNAAFEVAVTRYRAKEDLGLAFLPSLDQWRCTAGMCRRAAIPHSLKQAGEVLKLDLRKDARGEDLMKVFSIPGRTILIAPDYEKVFDKSSKGRRAPNRHTDNPLFGWYETDANGELVQHTEILWDWSIKVGGTEMTVREAWEAYKEYCRQDVKTEMVLHKKLHKFELTGRELESFQFNLRLNDRGVPVNVTALQNAQRLIDQYTARESIRFHNITGLQPSQSKKFKAWMQAEGYPYDDLQAGTVEKALTEFDDLMSPKALKALRIFSMLNFAALKKVTAMLRAVCSDGKVRGTLFWHGTRTGRATGKLIQPQNIKKATIVTDLAYDMLRKGCTLEDIEELWDSPLEVIASCARHFIELLGTMFYDADFVGVEARLTPWVAGEQTKLDKILAGIDLYKDLATRIFNVPYDEVTKKQRTIAKPAELGCCFGVAGKGLQDGLAKAPYYVKLSLKECQHIVSVYRKTHPKTVDAWAALEQAAKAAIESGGTSTILDGRVKVGKATTAGINYLVLRLPSGRRLYYPHARIKPTFKPYTKEEMQAEPWKAEKGGYWIDQIEFWGERPNNAGWGWVGTWGSRLFENCLTADTEVLTEDGWMPITQVGERKVFDGEAFVQHAGLRVSESLDVLRLDGLGVTPDHLVLTNNGWTPAKDVKPQDAYDCYLQTRCKSTLEYQRHLRLESREPDCNQAGARASRWKDALALPVRLWCYLRAKNGSLDPRGQKEPWAMQPEVPSGRIAPRDAPHELQADLCSVSCHARPMQPAQPSSLSQLRRQGNLSLRSVARKFYQLLQGHGSDISRRADARSDRQHGKLHPRELPMGVVAASDGQQATERVGGYASRENDAISNIRHDGNRAIHDTLPLEGGSSGVGTTDLQARHPQLVYDLLNCGPRNRFVVRAPGGRPLIVHNCVQAMGADLLDEGCISAEKAGFEVFLIVHDQALCYAHNELTIEDYEKSFCTVGDWAASFPLAAEGNVVPYYLKD